MSNRSLTGYDNKDALSGERDEEVYEYDEQTGKLVCASCDPTGARPVGIYDDDSPQLVVDAGGVFVSHSTLSNDIKDGRDGERFDHWLAGSVPGWDHLDNTSTYQPRYLSDSGRLFFDSPDGLVPQDTNKLEDVYEYEPKASAAAPAQRRPRRSSTRRNWPGIPSKAALAWSLPAPPAPNRRSMTPRKMVMMCSSIPLRSSRAKIMTSHTISTIACLHRRSAVPHLAGLCAAV